MSSTQLPTKWRERATIRIKGWLGKEHRRDPTKQPIRPKKSLIVWALNFRKFENRKLLLILGIGLPIEFLAIVGLVYNPVLTGLLGFCALIGILYGWDRLGRYYEGKVAPGTVIRLRWFHDETTYDEEDIVTMGGIRPIPNVAGLVSKVVTAVIDLQLKEKKITKKLANIIKARLKHYEKKYGKFELHEVERSLVPTTHPRHKFIILSNDALSKHLGDNPRAGKCYPFGWAVKHSIYDLAVKETKTTHDNKPIVFVVGSPFIRKMLTQLEIEQYGLLDKFIADYSSEHDFGSKWEEVAVKEKRRGDKFKDLHRGALDSKLDTLDSLEAQQRTIGGEKKPLITKKRVIMILLLLVAIIILVLASPLIISWFLIGSTPPNNQTNIIPMVMHQLNKIWR